MKDYRLLHQSSENTDDVGTRIMMDYEQSFEQWLSHIASAQWGFSPST